MNKYGNRKTITDGKVFDARIKQLFCRHRYADKNLGIVEINHYTDTVRLKNYCVKCGKPYEIKFSYSHMFGDDIVEIKKHTPQKEVR